MEQSYAASDRLRKSTSVPKDFLQNAFENAVPGVLAGHTKRRNRTLNEIDFCAT